jgi:hypothetical protein
VLVYGNIIATGTPDHPIPAGRKARIETVKIGLSASSLIADLRMRASC